MTWPEQGRSAEWTCPGVERGSSEDVVVPRQVVAVVFTKEADQGEGLQDVEGKEVVRASRDQICYCDFEPLTLTMVFRVPGVQALLKFETLRAAVGV